MALTTVLLFGEGRPPRPLTGSPSARVTDPAEIDGVLEGARRLVVIGSDADLAAVLSRLLRIERLDVEVAHLRPGPLSGLRARRATAAPARRVPLIRDDTGTVLVKTALWLPPEGADRLHGEAVVDDTVLFDGQVSGVRIEPTGTMPGLRAHLLGSRGRWGGAPGTRWGGAPATRWVAGRAAQLGTTGALVVRDGVAGHREVKRSTFYRHTTGWLRVDC